MGSSWERCVQGRRGQGEGEEAKKAWAGWRLVGSGGTQQYKRRVAPTEDGRKRHREILTAFKKVLRVRGVAATSMRRLYTVTKGPSEIGDMEKAGVPDCLRKTQTELDMLPKERVR